MRAMIGSTLGDHAFGLNFAQARRVAVRAGVDGWVIPGNGFICVFPEGRRAVGCNTTARTIEQGMRVVIPANAGESPQKAHEYISLGIAPDAVKKVVVDDGRERRAVRVLRNVYSFRSKTPAKVELER
jgi:hypothetical protein